MELLSSPSKETYTSVIPELPRQRDTYEIRVTLGYIPKLSQSKKVVLDSVTVTSTPYAAVRTRTRIWILWDEQ